jgi:hypothetical protein
VFQRMDGNIIKAAVVQAAPVLFDTLKTISKLATLTRDAAGMGTDLGIVTGSGFQPNRRRLLNRFTWPLLLPVSFRLEAAKRPAGDEMTLKVERVVDGGMN